MQKLLIYSLILLFPISLSGQFTDDFSDGDFTQAENWAGSDSDFIVNSNFELQLNAYAAGESYLSTEVSTNETTVWRFRSGNFLSDDPSSNNFSRVYVKSNNADLTSSLNGYYVKLGGESNDTDALELYRQDGTNSELVCRGTEGLMALSTDYVVEVLRDEQGLWTLSIDTSGTGFVFEANGFDDTYTVGTYIGVVCKYTSSNIDKFYFDDFFVDPIYVDTEAPNLTGINFIPPSTIELTWDENLDPVSAEDISNYTVSPYGSPSQAVLSNGNMVTLTYADEFDSGNYTIESNGIEDLNGNASNLQTEDFSFFQLEVFDILITEIMADYAPAVGLPESEYIELYNRSDKIISLSDLTISDASSTVDLPAIDLNPSEYITLCDNDYLNFFNSLGTAVAVSLPGLNNESDVISLRSSDGLLIHQVSYTVNWYQDNVKKDGGWSLEMIDTENVCAGISNWMASEGLSGGSPGEMNSVSSVNPDVASPNIITVLADNNTVSIVFDETLDPIFWNDFSEFTVNNGLQISASQFDVEDNVLVLELTDLLEDGLVYTLDINEISDCAGNILSGSWNFGLSVEPVLSDIIINEILYDPVTGGSDFIELYNKSDKIIDIGRLQIAKADTANPDIIIDAERIREEGLVLFPGEYLAVTENKQHLIEQYNPTHPERIYESELPSFNDSDDEGVIALTDYSFQLIDRVEYSEDWHYELIDATAGVSLERLLFSGESSNGSNWHSASSQVNYATPGYVNSQAAIDSETALGQVIIRPSIFSPDGDGFEDFSIINFELDEPGYSASVQIFSERGRLVRTLINNELGGIENSIKWDGINENGELSSIGIYVVLVELFRPDGSRSERFKETVVIAGKL